jgi:hypothetical protein
MPIKKNNQTKTRQKQDKNKKQNPKKYETKRNIASTISLCVC